jgi:hypothetical protein
MLQFCSESQLLLQTCRLLELIVPATAMVTEVICDAQARTEHAIQDFHNYETCA